MCSFKLTCGRARCCARARARRRCAVRAAATRPSTRSPTACSVIVKPDRRAPVVVVDGVVPGRQHRRGERRDRRGARARAHDVQGHARACRRGEYSRIIAAAGGRDNAFTSNDYTGYFADAAEVPARARAAGSKPTAWSNLTLSPEEWAKEIKVVMEERRLRTEDRPRSLVYEQLMATALTAHPYRNPVIGWMNDLREHARRGRARVLPALVHAEQRGAGRRRRRRAAQQVLGARGEAFRRHQAARRCPERKPQDEPPQRGVQARRRSRRRRSCRTCCMVFRAPPLRDPERDWEPYALEMLAAVLDGNEAARLPRTLVRAERVASSAERGLRRAGARARASSTSAATPVPGQDRGRGRAGPAARDGEDHRARA